MADWGLIAIRFALYADLMLLVGLSAFPLYSFSCVERENRAILPLGAKLVGLACAGLLLSLIGFAVASASMMGVPIAALDGPMLLSMANETEQGTAVSIRMVVLTAFLASFAIFRRSQTAQYTLALLSGSTALATLLWSGHAAATEGSFGMAHRVSDIMHMIAAALWIGGIAAFGLMLRNPAPSDRHLEVAARSLAGFSRVGTVAVAIILLTGVFNGYVILGPDITTLFQSNYGMLLTAKLALFGAMLALAANNRWKLTPALERETIADGTKTTWGRLRLSVLLEAATGAAILALIAWLGTLAPDL